MSGGSGPGGGTIPDVIRKNVPPGQDATVWDPTRPHGDPRHTDADTWHRREDGRVEHGNERVHIPEDPGRRPW